MANTQININESGTVTLATAGKYCDRNVDVVVDIISGAYDAVITDKDNGTKILNIIDKDGSCAEKYKNLYVGLMTRTISGEAIYELETLGSYAYAGSNITILHCPNVKTIATRAMYQCNKLTEFIAPLVETTSNDVFAYSGVKNVYMPNLTSLGSGNFTNCRQLDNLDFHHITSLGSTTFNGCSNLKTLILRASEVCKLSNTNCFTGTAIASGTGYVYVPDALVEEYKASTNWATYAAQIKPISELQEVV